MRKLSNILLVIGGIIDVSFAFIYIFFPEMLNWGEALSVLDLMNRGIMYAFNFFTRFILLGMAFVSVFMREELTTTKLGKLVLVLFAGFWLVRAGAEVVYFNLATAVSIGSFIVYLFVSVIYLIPVFALLKEKKVS